jgi:dinuclear metal center YbgI/SA1388 family protein
MSIPLQRMTQFLDRTLQNQAFTDSSNNGLQIANCGKVSSIVVGVDASLRLLQAAKDEGADFVLCHHGLSWGDSLKRLTGLNYELVSFAITHNIAVYASHLPLDAHPHYGNNAQLAKLLKLQQVKPAFEYHGNTIGVTGVLPKTITFEEFCATVGTTISPDYRALAFGPKKIRKIGIVSGGAAEMIADAQELGLDAFLTGEPTLQGYTQAENLKMNAVFAGHYATELTGVRALATLLTRQFGVSSTVIDFKITY